MQGIRPAHLGRPLPQPNTRELLAPMATITFVFDQYPSCYRQLLCKDNIGDAQANKILGLLRSGALYARSDSSVKDGCSAHVYGFTSGVTAGTIWGGSAITPGSAAEISSL